MSFNPVNLIDKDTPLVNSVDTWVANYKEGFIEKIHDQSMLDLVLPDDTLIVAGPPRARMITDNMLYVIGFTVGVDRSDQSQVQPLKAIGSRRHIFARTNAPVSLNAQRALFDGKNLLKALYANADVSDIQKRNNQYNAGQWYMNLEEDLFRVPIGIGLIYKNPRRLATQQASGSVVSAEYFEACTIQAQSIQVQAGSAVLMESVQMQCDRVVPFPGYTA